MKLILKIILWVHSVYELTDLAGQLWQMESALGFQVVPQQEPEH